MAIPIGWEIFEPQEGEFHEAYIKNCIMFARKNNLHAVLLWFGTWKNGQMEYTPNWVKSNTKKYHRVICKDETKTTVLSPHCQDNLDADKKAFCRMISIVKEFDGEENTVIAIQVENEPGYYAATRRDFGRAGEEDFKAAVPSEILTEVKKNPKTYLYKCWDQSGKKEGADWCDTFGNAGAEACTAWAIAKYINQIAAAGKKIYDIFMYTNAWTDKNGERGRSIGGIDYPCGGPVSKVLPIYYSTAYELDAIAPDIYEEEPDMFRKTQDVYARDTLNWPLFVSESHMGNLNSAMIFRAIGRHHCIGYHVFGVESCLDQNGELIPQAAAMRDTAVIINHSQDLILEGYKQGNLHTFYQRIGQESDLLNLDQWDIKISYCGVDSSYVGWVATDYRHEKEGIQNRPISSLEEIPGRGLLLQKADNEFYLAGSGVRLFFQRPLPIDGSIPINEVNLMHLAHNTGFLTVEEGYFEDGQYKVNRKRSGDELRHGIWTEADCGVIHIVLSNE